MNRRKTAVEKAIETTAILTALENAGTLPLFGSEVKARTGVGKNCIRSRVRHVDEVHIRKVGSRTSFSL